MFAESACHELPPNQASISKLVVAWERIIVVVEGRKLASDSSASSDSGQTIFDVRRWLATLTGCSSAEIAYQSASELSGSLAVFYRCGTEPLAEVRLLGLTLKSGRSAAWQLVARLADRVERVVVPGDTRFMWR